MSIISDNAFSTNSFKNNASVSQYKKAVSDWESKIQANSTKAAKSESEIQIFNTEKSNIQTKIGHSNTAIANASTQVSNAQTSLSVANNIPIEETVDAEGNRMLKIKPNLKRFQKKLKRLIKK